jgi:putative ABC transport system ATP-binding protein
VVVVTHDPLMGGRARRRIRMEDGAVVADLARDGAATPGPQSH